MLLIMEFKQFESICKILIYLLNNILFFLYFETIVICNHSYFQLKFIFILSFALPIRKCVRFFLFMCALCVLRKKYYTINGCFAMSQQYICSIWRPLSQQLAPDNGILDFWLLTIMFEYWVKAEMFIISIIVRIFKIAQYSVLCNDTNPDSTQCVQYEA